MQSLQAELRFSQLICSSCRHCSKRPSPKLRRSFHTASRPRAQKPLTKLGSIGCRGISDDAKGLGASRAEVTNIEAQIGAEASARAQDAQVLNETSDGPSLEFYGSPSKRRLRNRPPRGQQTETQSIEKVDDSNVLLWASDLAPGGPSPIQLVSADLTTGDPLESNASPDTDDSLPGETGSGGQPDTGSSRVSDDAQEDASPTPTPPLRKHRYFVVDEQYNEVVRTVRGALQRTQDPDQLDHTESYREHIHLHYAGKNGDALLSSLVRDVAVKLGCNLAVLDAQDIADMIYRNLNNTNPKTATDGQMLSYDVLSQAFPDAGRNSSEVISSVDDDESPDLEDLMDDEQQGPAGSIGIPVFTGKPGSFLKSFFGSLPTAEQSGGHGAIVRMFPDFTEGSDASKRRGDSSALTGVINKFLTSLLSRPSLPTSEDVSVEDKRNNTASKSGIPSGTLLVHVREFSDIQTTSIGNAFIRSLSKQIGHRRARGEHVLLIGTDATRDDLPQMTPTTITNFQLGAQQRKSQNIVITPVLPNTRAKLALLQDRKLRVATVNMRHLWKALRTWKPTAFAKFQPGFWKGDFLDLLTLSDIACLERYVWTYEYVRRLASYIAGAEPADPDQAEDGQVVPIISAAISHLDHSDKTKTRWAEKQALESSNQIPERHLSRDDRVTKIRASASKYEKRLLSGIIESKNINTTFNDVHMPIETIDALQTLTALSLTRPDAFKYGVLASNKIPGLLLYGPPGTGKTLAAKAVAKESGATMLEVSAADLNDMYVGESEKNVRALFSLARKLSPCVVFLDEADAMFRARSNAGPRVSHREQLNQFLKEWDGMSNDSASAFIMVATNRPMDLDDAVLRRLPRRLLVDLPTESDRLEILKIHLRHEQLDRDVDLEDLAKKTPFYSGSDLKNVAVAAAMNAVREENELAKKHSGDEPYKHAEKRTLTKAQFDRALEEISASISEDMSSLRDIKRFDEQYGDKRGKKKKIPRLGFPTEREGELTKDTVRVRD
jgi:SpoVK/Ycf46/Vps4 family AAA+-type ATPase